jgi:hypothetical protein
MTCLFFDNYLSALFLQASCSQAVVFIYLPRLHTLIGLHVCIFVFPRDQPRKWHVQALSGVLTLLTMSKTMLDLVLQLGGLKLVLELLVYEAHPSDHEDDVSVRHPLPNPHLYCVNLTIMLCANRLPL